MANGHGGRRPGAGRPKKPLAEKLLEGNPGKRPIKVVNFDESQFPTIEAPEFIKALDVSNVQVPKPEDIFKQTVVWLKSTNCLQLVNPDIINDYAIAKARWYEAEAFVARYGFVRKTEKDKTELNPFIAASAIYFKQVDVAWNRIWSIVAANSEQPYGGGLGDELVMGLLNFNPRNHD